MRAWSMLAAVRTGPAFVRRSQFSQQVAKPGARISLLALSDAMGRVRETLTVEFGLKSIGE
jgi:hypothetical protein